MVPRDRLSLMVITDSTVPMGPMAAALSALSGGATAVQIRWKNASTRQLLELARELREPTRRAGAILIINDRLDVALAADADGVHLGDDDLPLTEARAIVRDGFLIGRSVDSAEEAAAAVRDGADYVGLGPIHSTATKGDTGPVVGLDGISAVRARVSLPIVAIGGLGPTTAAAAIGAGADGIAVVSSVMRAADPQSATAALMVEVARGRALRPRPA